MGSNVVGEGIMQWRQEVIECIFDSFRVGEAFTTAEAVQVCLDECDDLDTVDRYEAHVLVLSTLNYLKGLHLIDTAMHGWRIV